MSRKEECIYEACEVLVLGAVAVVGFIGGVVVGSKKNKKEIKDAKEEGKQEAKAEHTIKISKVIKESELHYKRMNQANTYFETLIAIESIAVATIAYNKINVRTKQKEISDALRPSRDNILPENIKDKINFIYLKPPTIQEALSLAKNANLDRDRCRRIIMLSAESCDISSDNFLREWQRISSV